MFDPELIKVYIDPVLYSDLCNTVDKEMCKISGCEIPDNMPSTSPQARMCVNKIIEILRRHSEVQNIGSEANG